MKTKTQTPEITINPKILTGQFYGHFAAIDIETALDDATEILASVAGAEDREIALLAIVRKGDIAARLLDMGQSVA